MTARQYIFLIATGFLFFFIAIADLYLHGWNEIYNWHRSLSWYGIMSVIMFAIILLVLVVSPFIRKK